MYTIQARFEICVKDMRTPPSKPPSQQTLIQDLQESIRRQEGFRPDCDAVFSSGCAGIDRLLPNRGLRLGMIVEWLALSPGSHAGLIGLLCAAAASKQGGMLVIIDDRQSFYTPTAIAWGLDPKQLVVIQPADSTERIWAIIQSLESPAVAAVWSIIDQIDSKTYQRIRLAAQTGETLASIIRPNSARGQPTWSDTQFWLQPCPPPAYKSCESSQDGSRSVEISLARCRGHRAGGRAFLEIDITNGCLHETKPDTPNPLRLANQLAHAKNSAGRAGAEDSATRSGT